MPAAAPPVNEEDEDGEEEEEEEGDAEAASTSHDGNEDDGDDEDDDEEDDDDDKDEEEEPAGVGVTEAAEATAEKAREAAEGIAWLARGSPLEGGQPHSPTLKPSPGARSSSSSRRSHMWAIAWAVSLQSFSSVLSAPAASSSEHTSACPDAAAAISAVMP